MTLAAKLNNQTYYSTDITDDFGKQNKFTCIGCNSDLIYHRDIAGIKTQHWVHKIPCQYETEPETLEHLNLKQWIYRKLKVEKKYVPDSVFVGNQKPDIYIEDNGKKIAIEIQCSKISYENFLSRSLDYATKGVYVFWILGNKYLKGDKTKKRVSIVEKALHQLHYGSIFYSNNLFNLELNKYKFSTCLGYKEEFQDYGGYEYALKSTKKLMLQANIINFKLRTFINQRNNNTFWLAEFTPNQIRSGLYD